MCTADSVFTDCWTTLAYNVGDVMLEMTMMNSGPPGVHGNIGSSTTFGVCTQQQR
jgi:hypothetical protein